MKTKSAVAAKQQQRQLLMIAQQQSCESGTTTNTSTTANSSSVVSSERNRIISESASTATSSSVNVNVTNNINGNGGPTLSSSFKKDNRSPLEVTITNSEHPASINVKLLQQQQQNISGSSSNVVAQAAAAAAQHATVDSYSSQYEEPLQIYAADGCCVTIQYHASWLADDLCTEASRLLRITPLASFLFALRDISTGVWLPPSFNFRRKPPPPPAVSSVLSTSDVVPTENDENVTTAALLLGRSVSTSASPAPDAAATAASAAAAFSAPILTVAEFRMRFFPSSLTELAQVDRTAIRLLFHQIRNDLLCPHSNLARALVQKEPSVVRGLAVLDMIRDMKEQSKSAGEVIRDWEQYLPRNALKIQAKSIVKKLVANSILQAKTLQEVLTQRAELYNAMHASEVMEQYIRFFLQHCPQYLSEIFFIERACVGFSDTSAAAATTAESTGTTTGAAAVTSGGGFFKNAPAASAATESGNNYSGDTITTNSNKKTTTTAATTKSSTASKVVVSTAKAPTPPPIKLLPTRSDRLASGSSSVANAGSNSTSSARGDEDNNNDENDNKERFWSMSVQTKLQQHNANTAVTDSDTNVATTSANNNRTTNTIVMPVQHHSDAMTMSSMKPPRPVSPLISSTHATNTRMRAGSLTSGSGIGGGGPVAIAVDPDTSSSVAASQHSKHSTTNKFKPFSSKQWRQRLHMNSAAAIRTLADPADAAASAASSAMPALQLTDRVVWNSNTISSEQQPAHQHNHDGVDSVRSHRTTTTTHAVVPTTTTTNEDDNSSRGGGGTGTGTSLSKKMFQHLHDFQYFTHHHHPHLHGHRHKKALVSLSSTDNNNTATGGVAAVKINYTCVIFYIDWASCNNNSPENSSAGTSTVGYGPVLRISTAAFKYLKTLTAEEEDHGHVEDKDIVPLADCATLFHTSPPTAVLQQNHHRRSTAANTALNQLRLHNHKQQYQSRYSSNNAAAAAAEISSTSDAGNNVVAGTPTSPSTAAVAALPQQQPPATAAVICMPPRQRSGVGSGLFLRSISTRPAFCSSASTPPLSVSASVGGPVGASSSTFNATISKSSTSDAANNNTDRRRDITINNNNNNNVNSSSTTPTSAATPTPPQPAAFVTMPPHSAALFRRSTSSSSQGQLAQQQQPVSTGTGAAAGAAGTTAGGGGVGSHQPFNSSISGGGVISSAGAAGRDYMFPTLVNGRTVWHLLRLQQSKRQWLDYFQTVATIDELCDISVIYRLKQVQINRMNGPPVFLTFSSRMQMDSFVALVDGYHRLAHRFFFNLCKELPNPSLQRLRQLRCHGPVDWQFTYRKLRLRDVGAYMLCQSSEQYDAYRLDVKSSDGAVKSYLIERQQMPSENAGDIDEVYYQFWGSRERFASLQALLAFYCRPQSSAPPPTGENSAGSNDKTKPGRPPALQLRMCIPPVENDPACLPLFIANDFVAANGTATAAGGAGVMSSSVMSGSGGAGASASSSSSTTQQHMNITSRTIRRQSSSHAGLGGGNTGATANGTGGAGGGDAKNASTNMERLPLLQPAEINANVYRPLAGTFTCVTRSMWKQVSAMSPHHQPQQQPGSSGSNNPLADPGAYAAASAGRMYSGVGGAAAAAQPGNLFAHLLLRNAGGDAAAAMGANFGLIEREVALKTLTPSVLQALYLPVYPAKQQQQQSQQQRRMERESSMSSLASRSSAASSSAASLSSLDDHKSDDSNNDDAEAHAHKKRSRHHHRHHTAVAHNNSTAAPVTHESGMQILNDFLFAQQLCSMRTLLTGGNFQGVLADLYGIMLSPAPALVMEYFPMGNLRDLMLNAPTQRNAITVMHSLEAAACVAKAIWFLEEHSLAHGNVRARNVFVKAFSRQRPWHLAVKLGDPGLFTQHDDAVHWRPPETYVSAMLASAKAAAAATASATAAASAAGGGNKMLMLSSSSATSRLSSSGNNSNAQSSRQSLESLTLPPLVQNSNSNGASGGTGAATAAPPFELLVSAVQQHCAVEQKITVKKAAANDDNSDDDDADEADDDYAVGLNNYPASMRSTAHLLGNAHNSNGSINANTESPYIVESSVRSTQTTMTTVMGATHQPGGALASLAEETTTNLSSRSAAAAAAASGAGGGSGGAGDDHVDGNYNSSSSGSSSHGDTSTLKALSAASASPLPLNINTNSTGNHSSYFMPAPTENVILTGCGGGISPIKPPRTTPLGVGTTIAQQQQQPSVINLFVDNNVRLTQTTTPALSEKSEIGQQQQLSCSRQPSVSPAKLQIQPATNCSTTKNSTKQHKSGRLDTSTTASPSVLAAVDSSTARDHHHHHHHRDREAAAHADTNTTLQPAQQQQLQALINSQLTDSWAYATFLWEVFTLGEQPLPAMTTSEEAERFYLSGYRLPRPTACPHGIYEEVMLACWHEDPSARKMPQEIMRDINQYYSQNYLSDTGLTLLIELQARHNNEPYHQFKSYQKQQTKSMPATATKKDHLESNASKFAAVAAPPAAVAWPQNNNMFNNGAAAAVADSEKDMPSSRRPPHASSSSTNNKPRRHHHKAGDLPPIPVVAVQQQSKKTTTTVSVSGGSFAATSGGGSSSVKTVTTTTANNNSSSAYILEANSDMRASTAINAAGMVGSGGPQYDPWMIEECDLTLLEYLGEGRYGHVQKALLRDPFAMDDAAEGRVVAVKQLKASAGARFALMDLDDEVKRELDIMKSLRHERIVEIIGLCLGRTPRLVMEYINGGTLLAFLQRYNPEQVPGCSPITDEKLLNFACDVADGMHYLHSMNVVHRDLAARNVLVANGGEHVKISDFGLARFLGSDQYYVASRQHDIPAAWYAPEVLERNRYSCESDVWSYGVLVWELFSLGSSPNRWSHPIHSLVEKLHRGERLPQPQRCPDRIYQELMLRGCWAYKKDSRIPMEKIIVKLNEFQQQQQQQQQQEQKQQQQLQLTAASTDE